jgi:hypothetical protein
VNSGTRISADTAHPDHPDRRIVITQIGIVITGRSEATFFVEA